MESLDDVAHDSLFHHDEHYATKYEPLLVVQDVSPEVSI